MAHSSVITLTSLVVALVMVKGGGWVAKRVLLPPVVGEMVTGLLIGPVLLGRYIPEYLAPKAPGTVLTTLANVGVCAFMLTVGARIGDRGSSPQRRRVLAVALGSFGVSFCAGAIAATLAAGVHASGVRAVALALFVGIVAAVTALPVLARIVMDLPSHVADVGNLAVASSAIGDALAWALLALSLAISTDQANTWRLLFLGPFIVSALCVAKPVLARFTSGVQTRWGPAVLASVIATIGIGFPLLTNWMGLQLAFGAFVAGAIIPIEVDPCTLRGLTSLGKVTTGLLLPTFFVQMGLQLSSAPLSWDLTLSVVLVGCIAVVSKYGGTYFSARLSGSGRDDAKLLAWLMNTRGVTELVVLNIGLDSGLLSPTWFGVLCLVSVLSTIGAGGMAQRVARALPSNVARDTIRASVR